MEFAYYEDGKIQGTAYVYNPETGKVIQEVEYKDDVVKDKVKHFDWDGKVSYDELESNGKNLKDNFTMFNSGQSSEDELLKAIQYKPLNSESINNKN